MQLSNAGANVARPRGNCPSCKRELAPTASLRAQPFAVNIRHVVRSDERGIGDERSARNQDLALDVIWLRLGTTRTIRRSPLRRRSATTGAGAATESAARPRRRRGGHHTPSRPVNNPAAKLKLLCDTRQDRQQDLGCRVLNRHCPLGVSAKINESQDVP